MHGLKSMVHLQYGKYSCVCACVWWGGVSYCMLGVSIPGGSFQDKIFTQQYLRAVRYDDHCCTSCVLIESYVKCAGVSTKMTYYSKTVLFFASCYFVSFELAKALTGC